MPGQAFDWEWGSWVLGDMSDLLRRALDVTGRTVEVARVTVEPPAAADELPKVTLVLLHDHLFRVRARLAESEYPVRFLGSPTDHGWCAEALGMQLQVQTEPEERR
jgi:hypothetical protein